MGLKIRENLTQQAFRHIRDEIIRGKLDGRQHLTEDYFAERFGISKSPNLDILEALEQGKREAAANLMTEHIRTVRIRLLSHMQEKENAPAAAEVVPT